MMRISYRFGLNIDRWGFVVDLQSVFIKHIKLIHLSKNIHFYRKAELMAKTIIQFSLSGNNAKALK